MSAEKVTFSLEVYPPKTVAGMEALCGEGGVLQLLCGLKPDAVACTYGAGGSDIGKNLELLDRISRDGRTTPVTHFTCLGNTREGIRGQLQTYLDHGVRHMLARRGELPAGRAENCGELQRAAQLVAFARDTFGDAFTIAVSGKPEGRRSIEEDVEELKRKRDAGADCILTRLCWDMDRFQRWLDAVRAADIWLPVHAGVLPVTDQADIISTTLSRSGGSLPKELSELISRNWIYPNPFVKDPFDAEADRKKADFRAAGIAYTVRQIENYRKTGVSGIHLHTRNRFEDMARIVRDAGLR